MINQSIDVQQEYKLINSKKSEKKEIKILNNYENNNTSSAIISKTCNFQETMFHINNSCSFSSNVLDKKEVDRRLLRRDYTESHSFVYPENGNHNRFHKFFKDKLVGIQTMRACSRDNLISKRSQSLADMEKINEFDGIKLEKNNSQNITEYDTNSNDECRKFDKKVENRIADKQFESKEENKECKYIESGINGEICNEQDRRYFEIFQHNKIRKGIMDKHLTEEEKNELLNYPKNGLPYSNSVKKQNSKILEEYLLFCDEMNLNPFPLDENNSVMFLHYLGTSKKYNSASIDKVVCYSLIRLNLEKTHIPVSDYVEAKMRDEVNKLYENQTVRQPTEGMTPITTEDMKIIINSIPQFDPDKAKIASLFLFALSTGSRASTCAGVRLCHIVYFYSRHDKYNNYCVVIKQEILKSKKIKDKTVTISGDPLKNDPLNFLYWLNIYLINSFNTNINDLVNYNMEHPKKKKDFLWPWRPDSMTLLLKRRVKMAGLDLKKVGMHSLRSGFITSAISKHNHDETELKGVMEQTAIVADWQPYSQTQMRYIKSSTRRSIVCSDLVGITHTDSNGINNSFITSNFHQIVLKDPLPSKSYSFLVKNKVKEILKFPTFYNEFNKLYFESLYNSSLIRLANELFKNENLTYREKRSRTIKYINERIRNDIKSIDLISNQLVKHIKENKRYICEFDKTVEEKPISSVEKRNEILSALSGRKVTKARWSKEEEKVFIEGIEQGKSLKEISNLLYFRGYTECYDHLRSLNRRRSSQGLPPLSVPKSVRKTRKKNFNLLEVFKKNENELMSFTQMNSKIQEDNNNMKENHSIQNYEENPFRQCMNSTYDLSNTCEMNNQISINNNNNNLPNNNNNNPFFTNNMNNYNNDNANNNNSNAANNVNNINDNIYFFPFSMINELVINHSIYPNNPFSYLFSIPNGYIQNPFLNMNNNYSVNNIQMNQSKDNNSLGNYHQNSNSSSKTSEDNTPSFKTNNNDK